MKHTRSAKLASLAWTSLALLLAAGCGNYEVANTNKSDGGGTGGIGGSGGVGNAGGLGGSGGGPASCNDGAKSGDETGVDCGGTCPKCGDGQTCATASDCQSGACSAGVCVSSCSDGIQNGKESDTDCGGATCPKCALTKKCSGNADCASNNCQAGTCQAPPATCSDGAQGGSETDVDCGGNCPTCSDGKKCLIAADCSSANCTGNVCVSTCTDNAKNGSETDADCGGPTCAKCADGKACAAPTDCTSGDCTSNECVSSCSDGSMNGTETDVDCGGSVCPPCANTKNCGGASDCASGACTSGKCAVWSKTFGGSGFDDIAYDVAFDSQGNIIVVGIFGGSVNFGGGNVTGSGTAGNHDIFIAKYAPDGALIWLKHFGNGNNAAAYGVLVMPNDDIVVGGFIGGWMDLGGGVMVGQQANANAFVVRYTSAGAYVWGHGYAGSYTAVGRPALGPNGDIFITGNFAGNPGDTIDFGNGQIVTTQGASDIFVARLFGNTGEISWAKTFGGSSADDSAGIAALANGDVVITGFFFNDSIDFGGPTLGPSSYWDIYFARLQGANGDHVWSKSFNGGFNDYAYSVLVDKNDDIVLGGQIEGAGDLGAGPISAPGLKAFVAKYGSDGTYKWANVSQDPDLFGESVNGVALDANDDIVAAGQFQSASFSFGGSTMLNATSAGGKYDTFVAKFDGAKNHLWSEGHGGVGDDYLRAVAVFPPTGNIVAVGTFQQNIDFGDGAHGSNGMSHAVIVSFGPRP